LQRNAFPNESHCKAKAIGSNPLAGFPSQIPSSPVGAGVFGAWTSKPEGAGLI